MNHLSPAELSLAQTLVSLALSEDIGDTGDRTSRALIPETAHATAVLVARAPGVVAGLPIVSLVAAAVDSRIRVDVVVDDGTCCESGDVLARLSGPLRAILLAERTALNFLQHLSGVASLTRRFVHAVAGYPAEILDTRKTTPGWRLLEKYAVRCGGGRNHRLGLSDGVLIKDNHLAALGGDIRRAVTTARADPSTAGLTVEVEVDNLDQLDEALAAGADIVLLDNMTLDQLRQAVERRNAAAPHILLEASGGVSLATVREIAATGVDRISVGAITHSAPALDIGLDYES